MSDTFSYILPLVTLQRLGTLNQKIKLEIYECSMLKKKVQQLHGSGTTKNLHSTMYEDKKACKSALA
jgi:hypothetical protein